MKDTPFRLTEPDDYWWVNRPLPTRLSDSFAGQQSESEYIPLSLRRTVLISSTPKELSLETTTGNVCKLFERLEFWGTFFLSVTLLTAVGGIIANY